MDVHITTGNTDLSTLLGLISAILLEELTVIQMFQRFPPIVISKQHLRTSYLYLKHQWIPF